MHSELDNPIELFEHVDLGPLPHDPRLLRLQTEVKAWRKKYEDVFQEQCSTRTIDNSIREKLKSAENERDKLKAMVDAQREIIQWFVAFKSPEPSK
jgi:hypothetical protein